MMSRNAPQEMKTQTYAGTLMDASCAGSSTSSSTASSTASSTSTPAETGATASKTSSADRSAGSGGSCTVSSSTTQFALKTKDGNTVRFDDIGNTRMQEALKNRKKWSESASANKPIRVKASGVLNGDKLTVVSVN
jgi:hypothetical protein